MNILDEKFIQNPTKYIAQSFMTFLSIMIVLLLIDAIHFTAIVAAFGSTCFVIFTMPKRDVSSPRFVIGGYVVGTGAGCLCWYLSHIIKLSSLTAESSYVIFGALSVGISIFIMVITNTEHPPAAGLALGFVLSPWTLTTVLVVIIGVCLLSLIKEIIKPLLIDLL